MDENFDDCGGLGLSLLESKLNHDTEAFNLLAEVVSPAQLVWSAATLAAFMAQRAAVGLAIIDTGEPVSGDPDGGLWRVFSVAVIAETLVPDDELIDAISNVYRARDCFLRSLRDSVGDSGPDADGNLVVNISFWDGWQDGDSYEVIMGVGMALERLFLFDMASEVSEDPAEFAEASAGTLGTYHRFVAGGQL